MPVVTTTSGAGSETVLNSFGEVEGYVLAPVVGPAGCRAALITIAGETRSIEAARDLARVLIRSIQIAEEWSRRAARRRERFARLERARRHLHALPEAGDRADEAAPPNRAPHPMAGVRLPSVIGSGSREEPLEDEQTPMTHEEFPRQLRDEAKRRGWWLRLDHLDRLVTRQRRPQAPSMVPTVVATAIDDRGIAQVEVETGEADIAFDMLARELHRRFGWPDFAPARNLRADQLPRDPDTAQTVSHDVGLQVFVGRAIRARRRELGISCSRLASKSGLDSYYVGNVESGQQSMDIPTLFRIAGALKMTTTELVERVEVAVLVAQHAETQEGPADRHRTSEQPLKSRRAQAAGARLTSTGRSPAANDDS
jgi:transcriptional regulator with XRE-family HTH domain